MRKFIYLCSHLCVQVPLLPIAVLTVIPLAVCPSWRPWERRIFLYWAIPA